MDTRFLKLDVRDPAQRFVQRFRRVGMIERLRRIRFGLASPRQSGYRKYAYGELAHLAAWVAAWLVPGAVLLVLLWLGPQRPETGRVAAAATIVREPDREVRLDPLPPVKPLLNHRFDRSPPAASAVRAVHAGAAPIRGAAHVMRVIPAPATRRWVLAGVPIDLPRPGGREGLGQRRDQAARRAGEPAENAVLLALRWLKDRQKADGSWDAPPAAMTGLAVLCFLGHGELPGESPEFGDTVRCGIEWLLANQQPDGRFRGSDRHEYSLPIAAYALSEAAALTCIPRVRAAAARSVEVIVGGQNPGGGWNYNCRPSARNDTSYMGWCVQALKAARIAGVVEGPASVAAMRDAVQGFRGNAHPEGGFGYTGPGQTGLTGVGVLAMGLLGAGGAPETRQGLLWLERMSCRWTAPYGPRPLYYWYYTTQALFLVGGTAWERWDAQFAAELSQHQIVDTEPGGQGACGGYWVSPSERETYGPVYSTTLCTLMLEVYYRYLPTYRVSLAADDPPPSNGDGIAVQVTFPEA